jgi:arabinose-5-phosphate isomerase
MNEEIQNLLEKEINAILKIPIEKNRFEDAINLIIDHVHDKGGKLITSGMGKAGQIALNIATTFSSTGTPSAYIHPSEAQHGDLGLIQKDDVLLLLSNSGKTREILELIQLSQNLYDTLSIISITGNNESDLSNLSDICLHTGNSKEICPLGLTPTISTTLMTVIGDILVVQTMKKINFTKKEYSKRHHSGYLGQKSKEE